MKTNLKLVLYSALVLLASSCATMKVNYYDRHVPEVRSITLISTMIGRIRQPVLPLIDAAAFNEKTNSIADQIMDIQKQNINNYQEIVASSLKKYFNCEVIYGQALYTMPGFSELKSSFNYPNSLRIDNNHYPVILTSGEDINPFQYENGNVVNYFKTQNYRSAILEIARKTNTDLIAVSYSFLNVVSAGMFGVTGSLNLTTYIYIFEKDGDLIASAQSWSQPTIISGKQVDEYKAQLDNLSLIIDPLMSKVAARK